MRNAGRTAPGTGAAPQAPYFARTRRNKYAAQPLVIDGIRFASRREGRRYASLKLQQQVGHIRDLELQVAYPLHVVDLETGEITVIGRYVADFRYTVTATGAQVVEDSKGMRTPVYKLKKRHVEAQYAIAITES